MKIFCLDIPNKAFFSAGIIQVLEAFIGWVDVYSAFGICDSIRVFTAVCDSIWPLACLRRPVSSVCCYGYRTQTNQPAVCRPAVEMQCQKKRRRNTATFKNYQRLGYQQVLDMSRPFQEAGWMNRKRDTISVCGEDGRGKFVHDIPVSILLLVYQ